MHETPHAGGRYVVDKKSGKLKQIEPPTAEPGASPPAAPAKPEPKPSPRPATDIEDQS